MVSQAESQRAGSTFATRSDTDLLPVHFSLGVSIGGLCIALFSVRNSQEKRDKTSKNKQMGIISVQSSCMTADRPTIEW